MRNLIFRGKSLDKKEWVYGAYLHTPTQTYIVMDGYRMVPVNPKSIGQFTGLLVGKDKKPLYEGDWFMWNDRLREVFYREDKGAFMAINVDPVHYKSNFYLFNIKNLLEHVEIAGNRTDYQKGGDNVECIK